MGVDLLEIEVTDLVDVDWKTTLVPSAGPLGILQEETCSAKNPDRIITSACAY